MVDIDLTLPKIRPRLPSKRDLAAYVVGTKKRRIGAVLAAYAVLFWMYVTGNVPYVPLTQISEEGILTTYQMTEEERGMLLFGMAVAPPVYLVEKRALNMVYSPDTYTIRILDPHGQTEETWKLGADKWAELTVRGGNKLASRRTLSGKVHYALSYDPEENVAICTYEGYLDAGQLRAVLDQVLKHLDEVAEDAREKERIENNQRELIRQGVKHETRAISDIIDGVDPGMISGDGYQKAREAVNVEPDSLLNREETLEEELGLDLSPETDSSEETDSSGSSKPETNGSADYVEASDAFGAEGS